MKLNSHQFFKTVSPLVCSVLHLLANIVGGYTNLVYSGSSINLGILIFHLLIFGHANYVLE